MVLSTLYIGQALMLPACSRRDLVTIHAAYHNWKVPLVCTNVQVVIHPCDSPLNAK